VVRFRAATVAAATVAAVALMPSGSFADAAPAPLYVNNTSGANCSNAGSGTAAQPFCTIQAAASVVTAGQTVKITGQYDESITISRSGTASAPIVFDGGSTNVTFDGSVGNTPTLTFAGVHDVRFTHVVIASSPSTNAPAVIDVQASSRVTIDNNILSGNPDVDTDAVVHIDGASSGIAVTRNLIEQGVGPSVQVDAGSGNAVIAGNAVTASRNHGFVVNAATNAAVVNNTVMHSCGHAITVRGATTGATVENNIVKYVLGPNDVQFGCNAPGDAVSGLVVDATAAPGVTADYNMLDAYLASSVDYLWAGSTYSTSAAFHAATGQGAHDIDTDPGLSDSFFPILLDGSPGIDSGNSAAPGVPATDYYDQSRMDDPSVPNTGAGPYSYLDRGAYEVADQFITNSLTASRTTVIVIGTVQFTGTFSDVWSEPFTCSFDFGDGSTASGACTTSHTFTGHGTRQVRVTATNAAHLTSTLVTQVTVTGYPRRP
jgi:hypothetical protein